MDHEDSKHEDPEQVEHVLPIDEMLNLSILQEDKESSEVNRFATDLAGSVVKESLEQSGKEETEWSIQCSQDCHSHR